MLPLVRSCKMEITTFIAELSDGEKEFVQVDDGQNLIVMEKVRWDELQANQNNGGLN